MVTQTPPRRKESGLYFHSPFIHLISELSFDRVPFNTLRTDVLSENGSVEYHGEHSTKKCECPFFSLLHACEERLIRPHIPAAVIVYTCDGNI